MGDGTNATFAQALTDRFALFRKWLKSTQHCRPSYRLKQFLPGLRHSFNSTLANMGIGQETRMALTGHSSKAINNDYTHLELPKLKAAISMLLSLL
jgi:integrase